MLQCCNNKLIMHKFDSHCFVTRRSQLSAGQERQEGLITRVSSLEQAHAAAATVEAEAAAATTSSLVDVPLNGQVSSVPLAVMQQHMAVRCALPVMGQILCYSLWFQCQCILSAVYMCVMHTLCILGLCVLRSLHGRAASIHTAWLHSLSELMGNFVAQLLHE